MAKKKDQGKKPRKPDPDDILEISEEPEELVEIIDEPQDLVEIIDEPEELVEIFDAEEIAPSAAVDLGATLPQLADGSDVLEVEEAEIEFVEPPAKPVPPPPGAKPHRPAPPPPGARPRPLAGEPKSGQKLPDAPPPPTVPSGKRGAPTQMAPSKQAQPTQLAPAKHAQPTQLAPKQVKATQLAPTEDMEALAGDAPETPAALESKRAAKTQMAAKQAKPTQLAPKQAQATVLAPSDEAMDLPPGEKGAAASVPNLSLDDPADAFDIIEVVEDGSAIKLDQRAGDKPSGVDIIAEELESQVGRSKKVDEDETIAHELLADDDSSSINLDTAAGTAPVPIEVSEDLLLTDEEMAGLGSRVDLGKTEAFDLEGAKKEGTGEAAVIDESLLLEEAEKDKAAAPDEIGIEDLVGLEELDEGDRARKGKKARAADDEALFAETGAVEAEEEEPFAAAVIEEGDDETISTAVMEDAEEEDEGGVAVATKTKKKRRVERDDDEEEEERPRRYKKPKYGRRWLGGMFLGILLAAGGLFAVRSFYPEGWVQMNEKLDDLYPSPDATPIKILPGLKVGDVRVALEDLKNGKDEDALAKVKENAEVTKAIKDLVDAKQLLLKKQADDANEKVKLLKNIEQIEESQKALKTLLVNEKKIMDAATAQDIKDAVLALLTENAKQKDQVKDLAKDKTDLDTKIKLLETVDDQVRNLLVNDNLFKAGDPMLKDLKQAVDKALKERKDLIALVDTVNAKLKDAKITEAGIKGVEQLAAARDKLAKDMAELQVAAEEALKTINDGKPLPPGGDLKQELKKNASIISDKAKAPLVHTIGQVAEVFRDLGAGSGNWFKEVVVKTAAESKLKFYEAREKLIDTPERKLDTWIALFREHGFKGAASLDKAKKDADWVGSAESKSAPEDRSKAIYLQALMARNLEQFDQARTLLTNALKQADDLKPAPAWKADASRALDELKNAKLYFLPAAKKTAAQPGQSAKAIEQLTLGLKALPNDPNLLLERAALQFKLLPGDAKPAPEQQAAIRADAEIAKKDPALAPEAHFILGQLEERLGALDKALAYYDKALNLVSKENKQDANRYQQAIGRLLLIDPALVPATLGGAEGKTSGSLAPQAPAGTDSVLLSLVLMTVTAVDMDQAPGGPEPDEKMDEQIKKLMAVAEKFKKSEDPKLQGQGFMLYGLALSQQGKRTAGLMNYVKGLKMFFPGIEADRLDEMVKDHPAFLVPDVLTQASPAQAEKHFGSGIHLYFDGKYAMAEEQFFKAITYHKNDARYHYFLGLAQHAQKSKTKELSAEFNIRTGALLEVQDLPTAQEINVSLERIQGPLRQYLNELKAKAKLGE